MQRRKKKFSQNKLRMLKNLYVFHAEIVALSCISLCNGNNYFESRVNHTKIQH